MCDAFLQGPKASTLTCDPLLQKSIFANIFSNWEAKKKNVVVFDDVPVTYEQFADEIFYFAKYFEKAIPNFQVGDRGIFLIKNKRCSVTSILAFLLIGGVAVAADGNLKRDDLAFVRKNTRARVLVADASYIIGTHAVDFDVVFSIGKQDHVMQPNLFAIDPSNIVHDASCWYTSFYQPIPTDTVFLFFTSGSTGGPKLVASDHVFWNFNSENTLERFPLFESDVVGLIGENIGGVYSMGAFLCVLYKGASFVMCSIQIGDDGIHKAHHQLLQYQISMCFTSPVFFHFWLQLFESHPALASPSNNNLRTIVSAGDILSSEIIDRVMDRTSTLIANSFGATELGAITGIVYNTKEKSKYGSLGKGMKYTQLAILNDEGQELADNEEGLLAVKTVNSVSYWDNPEAQTNCILNGWHVTGDYAYRDANGDYWYCGRRDFLIQVYGYRIPTEQIERCMHQVPSVSQAVIIGHRNKSYGVALAIIVVHKEFQEKAQQVEAELKAKLKLHFKAHLLPVAYKFVESMPTTKRGKIDRFTLTKKYEKEELPMAIK